MDSSAIASLVCVNTWGTDLRADVAKVDVPTLVVVGDSDRTVPAEHAGNRTAKLIPGAKLVTIPEGPHALAWTHAEETNRALLDFLASQRRSVSPVERPLSTGDMQTEAVS